MYAAGVCSICCTFIIVTQQVKLAVLSCVVHTPYMQHICTPDAALHTINTYNAIERHACLKTYTQTRACECSHTRAPSTYTSERSMVYCMLVVLNVPQTANDSHTITYIYKSTIVPYVSHAK